LELTLPKLLTYPSPTPEVTHESRSATRGDPTPSSRPLTFSEHVALPGFGGCNPALNMGYVALDESAIPWQRDPQPPTPDSHWDHRPMPDMLNRYPPNSPQTDMSRSSVTPMHRFATPVPQRLEEDQANFNRTPDCRSTMPSSSSGRLPPFWPMIDQGPPSATPFVAGDWSEPFSLCDYRDKAELVQFALSVSALIIISKRTLSVERKSVGFDCGIAWLIRR